jgi:hypothetical protein
LNAFSPPKKQKELNDVIKMCTPGCAMGGKWFEWSERLSRHFGFWESGGNGRRGKGKNLLAAILEVTSKEKWFPFKLLN